MSRHKHSSITTGRDHNRSCHAAAVASHKCQLMPGSIPAIVRRAAAAHWLAKYEASNNERCFGFTIHLCLMPLQLC
jgi:hypothetical protein